MRGGILILLAHSRQTSNNIEIQVFRNYDTGAARVITAKCRRRPDPTPGADGETEASIQGPLSDFSGAMGVIVTGWSFAPLFHFPQTRPSRCFAPP